MKNESDRRRETKRYDYDGFVSLCLIVVTLVVSAVDIFLFRLGVTKRSVFGLLFGIFSLLGPLIFVREILSRLSINLNERGLYSSIFGIKIKKILWTEVSKVRKIRTYVLYGHTDFFEVVEYRHNLLCGLFVNIFGNIAFSQRINQCRDLLDGINDYARRYEIPLVVLDPRAAATRISRDPAPGRWRRGLSIDAEEKVSEL